MIFCDMGSYYAVKYEARREDGSLVTKSEELELIVKDGNKYQISNMINS